MGNVLSERLSIFPTYKSEFREGFVGKLSQYCILTYRKNVQNIPVLPIIVLEKSVNIIL
jgi:hypothetical protein